MSEHTYTPRVRSCGHCGHAPTLKTTNDGRSFFAWIECQCGIATRKQKADNMRHAVSNALHHWNTRDGEQKAAYATHQLRQAALTFVARWREGDYELSSAAKPDAVAIEKALGRVYRTLTGEQAA
jgi:hypothetical protein